MNPSLDGKHPRAWRAGRLLNTLTGVGLMLLWGGEVTALPSDRQKDLEIDADRAEADAQQGQTVYTGGVLVQQGTLKIDSETLTLTRSDSDGDRFVAVGNPATFQQQLELHQEPVIATGKRIEYWAKQERLIIDGNASILRNGQSLSSAQMQYDLSRDTLVADGNEEGKRVKVIIPARSNQADNSSEGEQQ